MKKARRPIVKTLWRSLRLLCPVCGHESIFHRPFKIKHHCSTCMALFKREAGFFVGAIMANVVTTEFLIMLLGIFLLAVVGADYGRVIPSLFVTALVFPVAFYHHSWSLWLGFDYLIESLPKYDGHNSAKTGKLD
ncbi:MAG TPA: hypothetical protein VGC91_17170 [Pyrinomonadaceae bacterium]